MKKRLICLHIFIILSLCFISILNTGCHCGNPVYIFTVVNQTSEHLIVTINVNEKTGTERSVDPGEKLTINWQRDLSPIQIAAKNNRGEIVFSKTFNMNDLYDLGDNVIIE
jgi:hypothetical protein